MPNREVNLTKRVRTAEGSRFCPVTLSANGRVKADAVLVSKCSEEHQHSEDCYVEERHPEGAYYIEWYEAARHRRLSVGKNAADANARRLSKEAELNAISHGVSVNPLNGSGRVALSAAVQDFLDEQSLQRKKKTHVDYETALRYFQQSCPKPYLEDITRKDLLAFSVYCREELELSPRTVFNKFARVVAFLRAYKIKVHEKGDAPKFVDAEPEVYEMGDLAKFFSACDPIERLWFEFFLMTGMREQEVMHVFWSDIKFADSVVRVTYKPELSWSPKAYKEREIPVPTKLIASLKSLRAKANGCPLVFPTAAGRPKLDFLDCRKAIAKRAGLNKEDFWLHKFRATFATWALWNGVDLRTVQQWLGHSDMESTMRYLKPSRSQHVRDKVNEIFA